MKKISLKHILYIYIVMVSIIIVTTLVAVCQKDNRETHSHDYRDFSQGWQSETGEPAVFSDISGIYSVSTTLPQLKEDDILYINAKTLNLSVFIEDTCVYETKVFEPKLFGYTPGAYYVRIPFEVSDSGKQITLLMDNPYEDAHGKITQLRLGNGSDLILDSIGGRAASLCISIVIIFIGLIFVIFFFPMCKKYYATGAQILYFGLFAFSIGIFMLMDSKSLQALYGNAHIYHVISEMFMLLIVVPMFLFFQTMYREQYMHPKLMYAACFLSIGDFVVSYVLAITGIMDYHESIRTTHLSYALAISAFIFCAVKSSIHTKSINKFHLAGVSCFCLGALLDILLWNHATFMDTSFCTRIGTLLLMCFEATQLLSNFLRDYRRDIRSEILERLAYYDGLTELLNRTSYIEDVKQLENDQPEHVLIAFFDVNNLKTVNDVYGHEAGDSLLIQMASVISTHFSSFCKCYRIGGDEFVAISQEPEAESLYLSALGKMEQDLQDMNHKKLYPYPLSIASGHAIWKDKLKDLSDIIKKADENMYSHKKQMKEHM